MNIGFFVPEFPPLNITFMLSEIYLLQQSGLLGHIYYEEKVDFLMRQPIIDKIKYEKTHIFPVRPLKKLFLKILFEHFADAKTQSQLLNTKNLPIPAYEQALKASHLLNLLDARGVLSAIERSSYITQVRDLVKNVMTNLK